MNEHIIAIEPADAKAFAPYGELLLPPAGEPVYKGIQASTWPTIFRADDAVQLMYCRFGWQEHVFTKLERHRGITQTFVALAPRPFVMVVAPQTVADEMPDPKTLRAFLVPSGAAVIIGDAVWHALDRFLLEPEPLDCLMLTSAGVQVEMEAHYQHGTLPTRTDMVDFAEQSKSFRLAPVQT